MDFSVTTPTGSRTASINLPPLPYGVLVSGGFDSSLLLALILITQAAQGTRVPFTAFNIRRGSGTERFSAAMVKRMSDHFGVPIPFESLDLPPGTPHQASVSRPAIPLLDAGRIVRMFSAETTNPPIETPGKEQPYRLPVVDQFKHKRWSVPLLHFDKSHTIALVRQLGLDFIETHSHTCTDLDEYRCRECFQCQERAWGYRTLGLTDPGEH